jgi:hypothetical protein
MTVPGFALLAVLLIGAGPGESDSLPLRHRVAGRVLSASVGAIRELRFAKEFRYAGGQRSILKKVADAEQHFFVAADKDGTVRRLYWIQFENFLPGIGEGYDYSADAAVTVDGVSFRRNTRRWEAGPDPDSDRAAMYAFLEKRGYRIPDGAIRVRLVHVPESNRREELMVVYAEAPGSAEADVQRRAAEGLQIVATSVGRAPSDAEQLLALHEEILRAHRESNIDVLLAAEEDDYVVANRGEITRPDRKTRREGLGPYLRQTRFSRYVDKVPPIVKVSSDGTLGWVIVQVEARGEQTTSTGTVKPVEFVSAWIELYEKRNGRWVRVGNVSNFKPGAS